MQPFTPARLLAEVLRTNETVTVDIKISGVVVTADLTTVFYDGTVRVEWSDDHGRDRREVATITDIESFEVTA